MGAVMLALLRGDLCHFAAFSSCPCKVTTWCEPLSGEAVDGWRNEGIGFRAAIATLAPNQALQPSGFHVMV